MYYYTFDNENKDKPFVPPSEGALDRYKQNFVIDGTTERSYWVDFDWIPKTKKYKSFLAVWLRRVKTNKRSKWFRK